MEAFAPEIARALAARLEIHHTPKHGSWLNMAETELSVLSRQCLDRRIDDRDLLGQAAILTRRVSEDPRLRVGLVFQDCAR